MTNEQKQKVHDLLQALALIEDNYGYIFRGSDEHRDLIQARKAVKAMLRPRLSGAAERGGSDE